MEKETTNNEILKTVNETIRREDIQVKKLVDILQKRNIISAAESKEILTMEPFAQISL